MSECSFLIGLVGLGLNVLLALKTISFVYMGLFIGLCSQWLNLGFHIKKEGSDDANK